MAPPTLRSSARPIIEDERAIDASPLNLASYAAFRDEAGSFAPATPVSAEHVPDQAPTAGTSPVVGNFPETITADELALRAAPLIVAPNATFSDADGDLAGAVLRWILPVSDLASLRSEGTGPGQIGLAPSTTNPGNSHFFTLTYGGTAVGSGTVSGNLFTVTYNAAATAVAVQQTIRNLGMSINTTAPSATHTVLLDFTDAAGHQLPAIPGDATFTSPTGRNAPSYSPIPFPESMTYSGSAPALVDLDGDGDLDEPFGKTDGTIGYFENIAGPGALASFMQRTGTANPFNGINLPGVSRMSFGDLDGDGDRDLVVGNAGAISFFRNVGTTTAPAFVATAGAANPFGAISAGGSVSPALGDLDGDGDLDLAVISDTGLHYYENIGTAAAPSFIERTGSLDPLPVSMPNGSTNPVFVDFDYDGDLDLAFYGGGLIHLRNTGTATAPSFASERIFVPGTDQFRYFAMGDVTGDGEFDVVSQTGGFLKGSALHAVRTTINVNLYNDPPALTAFPSSVAYAEGMTWILLTSAAVVTEADSKFMGVSLRVSGLLPADAIKVSPALLNYYHPIVTGGSGSDLLLSFPSFTSDTVLTQFLQSLLYQSTDKNPVAAHNLTFTITDKDGASTSAVLALNTTLRNDVPTLTDLAPSVTIAASQAYMAPQLIDPDVTVRDAESNFAGGVLTVAGPLADDRVALRSDGAGAGQIGVTGTTVTYGGMTVGTLAGGTGTTFTVTFNAAAAAASIEAVTEHLTYATVSDTPAASRVLQVSLTDSASVGLEGRTNYVDLGDPFNLLRNFDGHGRSLPAFVDLDGDGIKELAVESGLYLGVGARNPATGYFVDARPDISLPVKAVPFNGN